MNVADFKRRVTRALQTQFRRVIFAWGIPGVGKSSAIWQSAAEEKAGLVDYRLAQRDFTDIRGVLVYDPKKGKAVWTIPEELPDGNEEKRGILLMDELNLALPSVQAAAYQLILDRRIGEYKVPDGWITVAAGNNPEDSTLVQEMAAPLMNRFVHVDITLDFEVWRGYAMFKQFHPWVTGFLGWKCNSKTTEYLYRTPKAGEKAFPTPRSWEFASDCLKTFGTDDPEVVIGCVGRAAGTELMAFGALASKLEPMVEDIQAGKFRMPEEPHMLFFVCPAVLNMVAQSAPKQQIAGLTRYYEYIDYLVKQKQAAIASVAYMGGYETLPNEYKQMRKGKAEILTRLNKGPLGQMVVQALKELS